jgi:glycine C-acetyltransferase
VIPGALSQAVNALPGAQPERVVAAAGPGELRIGERVMVNMASNDYLGFARDPRVIDAARAALDRWGVGTAAGRVLSGTTNVHLELEQRLARWVGCESAVLHSSCWSANAAVLTVLAELAERSQLAFTVFSDRLNHASIIDAIRLQRRSIARLVLYSHAELQELRSELTGAADGQLRVIISDGIFSMEGDMAPVRELVELAREFEALLIVDDSHGTGVAGLSGRGSAEAAGAHGEVDVVTGTLGKALGGAIGGFAAGPAPLMQVLRQLSRPYVFSNNPPISVAAAAIAALEILEHDPLPLASMRERTTQLRTGITALGLRTHTGEHPIVPVLLGDEDLAVSVSRRLQEVGVFATALAFPIVARGEARIRLQASAAHTPAAIELVLEALAAG